MLALVCSLMMTACGFWFQSCHFDRLSVQVMKVVCWCVILFFISLKGTKQTKTLRNLVLGKQNHLSQLGWNFKQIHCPHKDEDQITAPGVRTTFPPPLLQALGTSATTPHKWNSASRIYLCLYLLFNQVFHFNQSKVAAFDLSPFPSAILVQVRRNWANLQSISSSRSISPAAIEPSAMHGFQRLNGDAAAAVAAVASAVP